MNALPITEYSKLSSLSKLTHDSEGETYRCGQRAAQALDERIGASVVTCAPKDSDRYGRVVAVCTARGEALSA